MNRFRWPIYLKMLLLFSVNLLLLVGLVYGFMREQFRLQLDWMLAGPSGERIERLAETLSDELGRNPQEEWAAVLRRYGKAHGITFALFGSDGRSLVGESDKIPREVLIKLIDKRSPTGKLRPPHPPRLEARVETLPNQPKPRFMLRGGDPARYWAGIHLNLFFLEGRVSLPLTLVMISNTLTAGGLFFDPWPWLGLGGAALLVSVLVWIPFVTGMTRSIGRLNIAARGIAHGRFEERVLGKRRDELGELATSVNRMAGQLGDYVAQQQRITRDVAHELCSPIARMQMALGVIDQRATPDQASYLRKLDHELQHMSRLVAQVLAFSKAGTLPEHEEPVEIRVRELVDRVITREAAGLDVRINIPLDLVVCTLLEALDRALGNVVRNAARYAGQAGAIQISAVGGEGRVFIRVADEGPGVPLEAISRLFEPFYRPELARGRGTGGSGLGLAIVKRSVEACGGSVSARLREPRGLEVELVI